MKINFHKMYKKYIYVLKFKIKQGNIKLKQIVSYVITNKEYIII